MYPRILAPLLLSILMLFGCASNQLLYIPNEKTLKFPALNEPVSTAIGSPLVIYKIEREYEMLEILEPSDYGICAARGYIPQGYAVAARYGDSGKLIYAAPLNIYGGMSGRRKSDTPAPISRVYAAIEATKKGTYEFTPYYYGGGCGGTQILNAAVRQATSSLEGEPDFLQELVYSGRTGDNIKFLYREYKSGFARGAYTQELQYDVSLSSIIRFKEVEMEVIAANNSELKYKVKSHFKSIR